MNYREGTVGLTLNVVKVKAGFVGQVSSGGTIIWESEPVPDDGNPSNGDNYNPQGSAERAIEAARAKVASVMEALFA